MKENVEFLSLKKRERELKLYNFFFLYFPGNQVNDKQKDINFLFLPIT